jgi:5,10-methylenetetrahydromethanopterin reductase
MFLKEGKPMFETAIYMPTDLKITQITAVAVLAEQKGYDYFMVPDEGFTRDVFVTLTSIAINTQKIKFGTAIINPYTRHPVTSAVTMATLNELSSGRAFIGFGAGGSLVLGPLGIEPKNTLSMCREAVELSRTILDGENVNFQGEFFNTKNAKLQFDPQARTPILMAGRGNKMLELAGSMADFVLLSGIAKFDLQRSRDLIIAGSKKNSLKPNIFYDVHVVFNDDLKQGIRSDYTFMIIDSPDHIKSHLGLSEEYINTIKEIMLSKGLHAASEYITDELLAQFIILGNQESCAEEIARIMFVNDFDVFTVPIPPVENPIEYVEITSEIISEAKKIFSEMQT